MESDRTGMSNAWGPDDRDPAIRALRILAGGVAHDFNNLLGGILGYSAYLGARAEAGSKLQGDLEQIQEAAETAIGLARRLQGFAQRRQFRSVPVSVPAVVDAALAAVERSRPPKVTVRREIPPDLPEIPGNPERLRDALTELLLNALEAMIGRSGDLTVSAAAGSHDGVEGVALEVLDTGEGIPAEHREWVFVPFYTTRAATGHRGLGLPMAYGILANHGGSLRIASVPGQGTALRVWLPAGPADPAPQHTAAEPASTMEGTETVLVVDDEPIVRNMTSDVLKAYGYQVVSAGSGDEALDVVRNHPGGIHLVIVDLFMPGKGGGETCRDILKLAPELPVLITTGSVQQGELEERLVADGASGVLYKPFHSHQLASRVRQTLDRGRSGADHA